MRARMPLLFLPVLLLPLRPLAAFGEAGDLWRKAVEAVGRAKSWVPGSTEFRLEMLDDKGNPTGESQETWYRLSPEDGGGVRTEVVRSLKNGKDNTKEDRETQERQNRDRKKDGRAQPFSMGDNPMDPEVQGNVEVKPAAGARTIEGQACVAYEYSLKTKSGRIRGTVWLSGQSGLPLEMSMGMDPLPAFVQKMSTVLRYERGPAGEARVREALVEGTGGVLFIRKNFRMSFRLGGWWRQEGAVEAP